MLRLITIFLFTWIFSNIILAQVLDEFTTMILERAPLQCDRNSLIETVRGLEELSQKAELQGFDVENFQQRLNDCHYDIRNLGRSSYHLEHILQYSRMKEFRDYEDAFLNREASNYRYLLELAERAGQRVSSLERRYQSHMNRIREQCRPEKDLRDRLPPVRDQDSTGLCFAFAVADLASYRFGQNISPMGVSLSYYEGREVARYNQAVEDSRQSPLLKFFGFSDREVDFTPDSTVQSELRGGWTDLATQYANELGYCLESSLPSEGYEHSSLKSQLQSLEQLKRYADSEEVNTTPGDAIYEFREEMRRNCHEILDNIQLFPGLDLDQIWDIIRQSSLQEVASDLANLACEPRINDDINYRKVSNQDAEGYANSIHSLLDEDKLAVVSYDVYELLRSPPENNGWHASSIVGRRWNEETGSCELLLRNSWGTGCASYKQEYDCEDGQIWIPEGDILKSVYGVTYDAD